MLRTESAQLYDRLKARKYSEAKLQENLDSEIMEVLLSEARDSYDKEMVVELWSNGIDDMDTNLDRIETWIVNWRQNNDQAIY